jgi:hypothetical protein
MINRAASQLHTELPSYGWLSMDGLNNELVEKAAREKELLTRETTGEEVCLSKPIVLQALIYQPPGASGSLCHLDGIISSPI